MWRLALLVVLVPVIAPGCGGGSEETTTRVETRVDTSRSKAGYIEVADVICTNHQSRREDLESQASELRRIDSAGKARRVAVLLHQESRNLTSEVQELETLQPPPRGLAPPASILSGIRARARLIDDLAEAYDDLDSGWIRKLQTRLRMTAAATAARARAYGFDACGR